MPEIGDGTWCEECRARRRVVDSDIDSIPRGHIGGEYEERWRWVVMTCGHRDSWPVNQ